jgi:hypothetical protein
VVRVAEDMDSVGICIVDPGSIMPIDHDVYVPPLLLY